MNDWRELDTARLCVGATGWGVSVAVIDSGWDRTQEAPAVGAGAAFLPTPDGRCVQSADDDDRMGHGTACADIVIGHAPAAEVMPVRIFARGLTTTPACAIAAIGFALERGAKVINLSFSTDLPEALPALYHVCERARRAGAILVAAHEDEGETNYPSCFENVLSVGAAEFAQPSRIAFRPNGVPECRANGERQSLLWRLGQRRIGRGSSYAAAHMSGIIARLVEREQGLTLESLRERLALAVEDAGVWG